MACPYEKRLSDLLYQIIYNDPGIDFTRATTPARQQGKALLDEYLTYAAKAQERARDEQILQSKREAEAIAAARQAEVDRAKAAQDAALAETRAGASPLLTGEIPG